MLEQLTTWWQELTPETQTYIQEGSLFVAALIGGHFLGTLVARGLYPRNFDAAVRLPGAAPDPAAEHGFTPTFFAGVLVRLTVWTAAVWWLALEHNRVELAGTLMLVVTRTWAVSGLLVVMLGLGRVLTRRLISCLELVAGKGAAVEGAVGAAACALVGLLVVHLASDFFDWPLTRNAVTSLWQLAQSLLLAGAVLGIGAVCARWARSLATAAPGTSPEQKVAGYAALGIAGLTTVLALGVLFSSARAILFVALVGLATQAILLWLLRTYLPDIVAGLKLRGRNVREVWLDGAAWQVGEVGFFSTQVVRAGAVHSVKNRLALRGVAVEAPGAPAVQ